MKNELLLFLLSHSFHFSFFLFPFSSFSFFLSLSLSFFFFFLLLFLSLLFSVCYSLTFPFFRKKIYYQLLQKKEEKPQQKMVNSLPMLSNMILHLLSRKNFSRVVTRCRKFPLIMSLSNKTLLLQQRRRRRKRKEERKKEGKRKKERKRKKKRLRRDKHCCSNFSPSQHLISHLKRILSSTFTLLFVCMGKEGRNSLFYPQNLLLFL